LGRVYKSPVLLRSVHRGESAAVANAVRGPEPQALELETPRPLGAARANRAEAVGEQKITKIENKSKNKNIGNGENGIVPLNVWAENPSALEATVWRADTVRLLPTPEQVELLLRLAKATRALINMEHARRRQLYERTGEIDTGIKHAYWSQDYAQLKELLGSKNFDEALCLVAESWRSFKELLELKEQGRLPAWLDPKPPKRLKSLIIAVKHDNYRLLEDEKAIWLGYYNVKLKFKGDLRWWRERLQQGRLVITYDDVKGAWYAHIASEVELKRDMRAPLKCGIDLGRERLAAAVTESGVALLYRGTVLKSEYHFLKMEVSELDKRARFADFDVQVWLEKRKWLFRRYRVRKRELIKNMAAHLARELYTLGVTEIYIGYPRDIAHNKPTEGNNAWPYWQTIKEIARAAENLGIAVYLVPEESTSRVCARHGCEVVREPRGLVRCPYGHVMHADLNAAMNILKRAGGRVPERVKVLSFTPTPEGVIERRKKRRGKPDSPAQRAG
jgi:putative transposase